MASLPLAGKRSRRESRKLKGNTPRSNPPDRPARSVPTGRTTRRSLRPPGKRRSTAKRSASSGSCRLRQRGGRSREPLLDDRPVQRGRNEAEGDRDPPHHVVIALQVEQPSAAPAAEEAADLMAEEHDAVQHGKVDRPEDIADQRGRERHGAEPQETQ